MLYELQKKKKKKKKKKKATKISKKTGTRMQVQNGGKLRIRLLNS